jgi:hypothetical protein
MRAILIIVAFTLSVATANARSIGPGGLSFDCSAGDAGLGQCVCLPPASSQDCQNMTPYCDGPILCGWFTTYCSCHQRSYVIRVRKGRIIRDIGGIKATRRP